MRFKSNRQRKFVMANLEKGDLVQTRLFGKGIYGGTSAKGYRIHVTRKHKVITIISKVKPKLLIKA